MTQQQAAPATKTVARNFSAMFASQIVFRVLALVFNIYTVRTLGESLIGRYAAALAFVQLFAVLSDFGLQSYSIREMARDRSLTVNFLPDLTAIRAILSTALILTLTTTVAVFEVRSLAPEAVFIASLALLFNAWTGPLYSVLIAWERMELAAMLVIVKQLVYIFAGFALLQTGFGYLGLLAANVASGLGLGVGSWWFVRKRLHVVRGAISPRRWGKLIRSALPFGITGGSAMLTQQFDTVLMAFLLSSDLVGRYTTPFNLMLMLTVIAPMLGNVIFPTLVREYGDGSGEIRGTIQRIWRYLLLVALPLAVGGAVLADRIILVLYAEEFVRSVPILRLLVLALPMLFSAELFIRIGDVLGREKRNARLGIVMMTISVIMNVVMISIFGIIGAAITYLTVRLVQLGGLLWIANPLKPVQMLFSLLQKLLPPLAVMGAAAWLASASLDGTRTAPLPLIGIIGVSGLLYIGTAILTGAITRGELTAIRNPRSLLGSS